MSLDTWAIKPSRHFENASLLDTFTVMVNDDYKLHRKARNGMGTRYAGTWKTQRGRQRFLNLHEVDNSI